jgi:hypothetical protein
VNDAVDNGNKMPMPPDDQPPMIAAPKGAAASWAK